MTRSFSTILGATLAMGCGSALAQGGDLAGVTMRVLDDVSDVRAVVIELDSSRGQGEEGADRDGGARGDEANAADAAQAPGTRAEEDSFDEPRGRAELHHPDDDENAEGKLEDNDVERPPAPATP
jgi:hypothetical protein